MKTFGEELLLAIFMGLILPGVMVSAAVLFSGEDDYVPPDTAAQTIPAAESVPLTMRQRNTDGTVVERDLDTYLVGVVLAEMPAFFETEALKAQAVVARTYTRRAYETGGKHSDGSVCTQSSCCQAYISESDYLEKGGREADVEKVRSAVLATSGQVLTYEGKLIEATYFSCSGGVTEDAQAVWGTDFPYLRSVESPGEEDAAYYAHTVSFTSAEFRQALGKDLPGAPSDWFGSVTYTPGNGVDAMEIGGQFYKGTELRKLLGLRSTVFSVSVDGDTVSVQTRGYGHRVGMSQYGADAMAVRGSTYAEILAHYYQGTALETLESDT